MKSEPESYSIVDFKRDKTTLWEGVRNYQARNFMMNDMQVGDAFLFYHSNAEPPGVAGVGMIQKVAVPDPSALDAKSKYFDPKAAVDRPIWYCASVKYESTLPHFVALEEVKKRKELKNMVLVKPGTRLSIQPVTEKEFRIICEMGGL
jgi:predicted RNA-binding protein with PUA-like domain